LLIQFGRHSIGKPSKLLSVKDSRRKRTQAGSFIGVSEFAIPFNRKLFLPKPTSRINTTAGSVIKAKTSSVLGKLGVTAVVIRRPRVSGDPHRALTVPLIFLSEPSANARV
jgi:hypothetical protein